VTVGTERITTVHLAGEVDIRTASEAQALVTTALTAEKPEVLVVDLEHVGFLDSVGIGFLVGLNQQARDVGVALRLRGLQPQVYRVLAATGLVGVLEIETP
jgi:anti-sigma B factor antagonist